MNGQRCLLCRGERRESLKFRTLLSPDDPPGLCRKCRAGLLPIAPEHRCRGCGRDLRRIESRYVERSLCIDCRRWRSSGKTGSYGHNVALYSYNETMKEIINLFKFRGDALLAEAFRREFRTAGRRLIGKNPGSRLRRLLPGRLHPAPTLIVPIPLSRVRQFARGFNQAELLANLIGESLTHALIRPDDGRKQSKKTRSERLSSEENPYLLNPQAGDAVRGRNILLIDDIYTTGATLHRAALALEAAKPERIDSLTLIHG